MKTQVLLFLNLALAAAALTIQAQNTVEQATVPAGPRGPGWNLTPEQRAERQQQVQAALADLRAKRDNGTISANEKAWLERMEQAGGWCVNGVRRGGGGGAGWGPRAGTGARAQAGVCPLVNTPSVAGTPPTLGRRGPGPGMGWRGGRGGGGGFGPGNGTGPRSQTGTCPLLNLPPGN